MTKANKLKICNITLLLVALPMLISSIQMEVSGGKPLANFGFAEYMAIHAVLGSVMIGLLLTHLYLHFGWQHWPQKIKKLKNKPTKLLCACFLLMLVSGIVSFLHNVASMSHSIIGAIHGKIGFVFLAICIGHIIKRWWWFKKNVYK